MRYLVPAADIHDEVDLVTIPSVGMADAARPEGPRHAIPLLSEGTLSTVVGR
jgi:hypothetical protein